MKCSSKSRKEDRAWMFRILKPRLKTAIVTWNVRTLNGDVILEQILEISEGNELVVAVTHWVEQSMRKKYCSAKRQQNLWYHGNPLTTKSLQFKAKHTRPTVILTQVYSLTNSASEEDINELYVRKQDILDATLGYDLEIFMGALNAQVRADNSGWEEIMGKWRMEKSGMKMNDERFLSYCIAPTS